MSVWHGYLAIMDVALLNGQRGTVWQLLQGYGLENEGRRPHRRFCWRDNLAADKRICKAAFDDEALTVSQFKQALATALGLAVADIATATTSQTFLARPTPIVTFKYSPNTTARLRLALFGGVNATWAESRAECLAYVMANLAEWDTEL
jgi:hypothetical protein